MYIIYISSSTEDEIYIYMMYIYIYTKICIQICIYHNLVIYFLFVWQKCFTPLFFRKPKGRLNYMDLAVYLRIVRFLFDQKYCEWLQL